MNGISVLSLIGAQADMIVLSRLLGASAFGYYTLSRTAAQSLVTLAAPAYQSAFPQLSKLAQTPDRESLAHTFHRCCQLLAMILLPAGIVLCIFSGEVLALWTHNTELARNAGPTLSLLAAGSAVYGIGYMISALQMANGAVRLMIALGAAFVCLIIPALIILVHFFQQTGAAMAWLGVNVLILAVSAIVTLRRYLAGELTRWLAQDNLLPALAAVLPVVVIKSWLAGPDGSTSAAVSLFVAAFAAMVLSVLTQQEGRALALRSLASIRVLFGRS
jgi:O-antigen/teichoic acid export membrane protein